MPITEKQQKFIEGICHTLELKNPRITDKTEASKWISEHIDDYHEKIEMLTDLWAVSMEPYINY